MKKLSLIIASAAFFMLPLFAHGNLTPASAAQVLSKTQQGRLIKDVRTTLGGRPKVKLGGIAWTGKGQMQITFTTSTGKSPSEIHGPFGNITFGVAQRGGHTVISGKPQVVVTGSERGLPGF